MSTANQAADRSSSRGHQAVAMHSRATPAAAQAGQVPRDPGRIDRARALYRR
ncbi:hypothetical protein ACQP1G_24460 [Nocardia sp. CA-107356]|uniref:hypothetical protein n=1 Tax=Nocardia sp. CA-107356 TaxID=3239972 RepID=UPI003D8F955D